MRLVFFASLLMVCMISCNKDKYTTEPQLSFKTFTSNVGDNRKGMDESPSVVLEVRDEEGDIGFIAGKDTAQVYIKNTFTGIEDSFYFPDLRAVAGSNFKAEIQVRLFDVMGGRDINLYTPPYSDTIHFEIYVKDFKKNKSNVILTTEPFIFHTLP